MGAAGAGRYHDFGIDACDPMNDYSNPPPRASRELDALDFQITDFEDARRALEEPPAGVAGRTGLQVDYWSSRRRSPLAADRALTGIALDWLMRLPRHARPQRLCASFPRLANLIAQAWPDPQLAATELDQLIEDRRGGRRGFPEAVRSELFALRAMLNA